MIGTGIVVENKETGNMGVVVNDPFGVCTDSETPVVYEGTTGFSGTDTKKLKAIGPENAQANPKKCGAGQGEKACIFLALGVDGFSCERFGSLRYIIVSKKEGMRAKREPTELYPNCQLN